MKKSGVRYLAKSLDGLTGIISLPYEEEGIEGAKHAIDRCNREAEKNGYEPSRYLIVRKKWSRYYDEEGIFCRSTCDETVMDIYPYTNEVKEND